MKAKNTLWILALFLLSTISVKGQLKNNLSPNSANAPTHQNRIEHLQEARVNFLVNKMKLSGTQEQEFRSLYSEYENSRSEILKSFRSKFSREDLSEEEARKKIYEGFDLSEKLLENKRSYADRFLKIVTAVQLDEMFRLEKAIGRHVMEKKRERSKGRK